MNKVDVFKDGRKLTINDKDDAIEVMKSHGWSLKDEGKKEAKSPDPKPDTASEPKSDNGACATPEPVKDELEGLDDDDIPEIKPIRRRRRGAKNET